MELIGLIFASAVGVVCLQRVRWQWGNRREKESGRYRGGAALGNALQAIQAFAQPHVKHVIEQRVDEAAEEEDEASQDSEAHWLRQAKRIRNGEEVDRLTALLPPKK